MRRLFEFDPLLNGTNSNNFNPHHYFISFIFNPMILLQRVKLLLIQNM